MPSYPPTSIASLRFASGSNYGVPTVVTAGTDPNTGNNLHYPLYGSKAVLVSTLEYTQQTAVSIYQAATLTSSDVDPSDSKVHIRFAVAPVIQKTSVLAANSQSLYLLRGRTSPI